MKTKLTLLFIAAASFFVQAQNTEACTETLSLMTTSVKAKDVASYDYLTTLRKDCPSFHKSIYSYGELAIKMKIEKATTPQDKEKYVRDLLKLYDEHDQYFPGNGAGNKMKKGLVLFENKVGTTDEVFQLLDVAFKTDYANILKEINIETKDTIIKGVINSSYYSLYNILDEFLRLSENNTEEISKIILEISEKGVFFDFTLKSKFLTLLKILKNYQPEDTLKIQNLYRKKEYYFVNSI